MPAPAGPVLHPLAGLSPGTDPVRARQGVIVRSFLAAGVVLAAASCGASPGNGGTTSWWQGTGGVSACGSPAVYRVNGGPTMTAGDCAGLLVIPSARVIVAVGSEVDVHIAQEESAATGTQLVPMYPTPSSDNTSVLKATSVADGGSTESFVAVGPGTANVMTRAYCLVSPTLPDIDDACPVLEVGVS